MIEISEASRVYVDSNVFIYFIEKSEKFFVQVSSLFEHAEKVGARLMTSELTIAECIYKPAQDGDRKAVNAYEALFEQSDDIEIVALDGALAKRAALAGGLLGLKLIDAIHYVSALDAGCDFFITADAAFKSTPKMKVLRLAA